TRAQALPDRLVARAGAKRARRRAAEADRGHGARAPLAGAGPRRGRRGRTLGPEREAERAATAPRSAPRRGRGPNAHVSNGLAPAKAKFHTSKLPAKGFV